MSFIQIIEYETTNFDEIKAAVEDYQNATAGTRGTTRARVGKDRERENRYFTIVEFESYDEAMRNSERPETSALAAKLQSLAAGPPTFLNLDVVYAEDD